MRFSTKIFFAILVTTILSCAVSGELFYYLMKSNMQKEYFTRYQSLGRIIGNTFNQLENSANLINENAVRVLYEYEKNSKLPSDQQLEHLAKNLGIKAFYVTNKNGKFIRSTDLPLKLQTNSLFKYCKDYSRLVKGDRSLFRTPIIPGFPNNIPMKLTMIPNHNRTMILESGMELEYIGNVLNQAIKNDPNIKSIGFYAPTGFELGYISGSGLYRRGRQNNSLNFNNLKLQDKVFQKRSYFFNVMIPSIDAYCCECVYKNVSNSSGKYFYILRFNISLDSLNESISLLRKRVIIILLLACVLSILLSKILARKLVNRIKEINKTASDIIRSNDLDIRVEMGSKYDEIGELASTFNKMIESLKVSQSCLVESEKKAALLDLAARVAHDIRSPLAALNILTNQDLLIPEQLRTLLRNVINRIRDIANDLIEKNRYHQALESADEYSVQLLTALIYPIITEKRLQLRSNSQIIIEFETNFDNYGLFFRVNSIEFKRMLSNLINNSIEAISEKGIITLNISHDAENIYLTISDNGRGIPSHILSNLGKQGVSYDKKDGSGFGLHHAKIMMEKAGGSLKLMSEITKGTKVILAFPKVETPNWFLSFLQVHPNTALIVVDDDISIYQLWQERFNLLKFNINMLYFSSPSKFQDWIDSYSEHSTPILYFFDLEYIGITETGFDLIERNKLQANSVLITSHFEREDVWNRCEKLNIKMVPKDLAMFLPIFIL